MASAPARIRLLATVLRSSSLTYAIVSGLGLLLGWYAVAAPITLRPSLTDAREFSTGLTRVARGDAWRLGDATLVLDAPASVVAIRVAAARHAAADARVTVALADGPRLEATVGAAPATLRLDGLGAARRPLVVSLHAQSAAPTGRLPLRVREIALERAVRPWRWLLVGLPALAGLLGLGLSCRSGFDGAMSWVWVAVSMLLVASQLMLWEKLLQLPFEPVVKAMIVFVPVLALWALACTVPHLRWVRLAALAATVLSLGLPTLHFGLVADDFCFTRPLSAVELLSTLYGQWEPRAVINAHYRPVAAWLWAADYAIWGAHTWGYHATNLLLFAGLAACVYRLLRRLIPSDLGALLGALVFASHPLGAAALTWPSERTDTLAALFVFACLTLLSGGEPTRQRLVFGFVLAALALGSKEIAVVLPAALVLLALLDMPRRPSPRVAVAVLVALALVFVGVWALMFPHKFGTGASRGVGGLWSVTSLIELYAPALLPYDLDAWRAWADHRLYLLAAAVCAPLLAALLWRRDRRLAKLSGVAALWPWLCLLPVLPLGDDLDLRRLGLLMGFALALLVAAVATWLGRRSRRAGVLGALALGVWLLPLFAAGVARWAPDGATYGSLLDAYITRRCVEQTEPALRSVYREQVRSHAARRRLRAHHGASDIRSDTP
jgi:hypothetical protein